MPLTKLHKYVTKLYSKECPPQPGVVQAVPVAPPPSLPSLPPPPAAAPTEQYALVTLLSLFPPHSLTFLLSQLSHGLCQAVTREKEGGERNRKRPIKCTPNKGIECYSSLL